MPIKSTDSIRQAFLNYFQSKNHTIVPSSSLVPADDPSLLFTNAGMVQFKDVFLGKEVRPYTRATTVQRCVRAGGKHNDLENVGYTARHHTFFEMLGNFSFGDYFKREAITYAWEFLTQVLELSPKRLWVTVFEEDKEAETIWLKEMKIDPKRFSRLKDNFWAMGDIGPCGPCSEIFYDHGESVQGGPPGTAHSEGDRYVEIWNLVFMQFNRDAQGRMTPLPKPSIDTGMGLERIAAVMQGVHNNYDIDLFRHLIQVIAQTTDTKDLNHPSLKVIADHIRAAAFLIMDGVNPSNEGRGYVLRRIMRRAIRHGYKLNAQEPFFFKLVSPLVAVMGSAYPQLKEKQTAIEQVIFQEEEQFSRTLSTGIRLFEQVVAPLKIGQMIPGEVVFKLYDTYGFPVDLTSIMAKERRLIIDEEGFEQAMERQQSLSQHGSAFEAKKVISIATTLSSQFVGYETLSTSGKIIELLKDGKSVEILKTGDRGIVILDQTSFYAEKGGQVGDKGRLYSHSISFEVEDTRQQNNAILHYGLVKTGLLTKGDILTTEVDNSWRQAVTSNHSATHLLQAALIKVLGSQVMQKGSLVAADRLRFDFSYSKPMMPNEIKAVEHLVNEAIRSNVKSEIKEMTLEEAKTSGAKALFDEKYGKTVRVIRLGDFSREVCGGTHVKQTGEISYFKIVLEEGIAAGVRRIEAVTGQQVEKWIQQRENIIGSLKDQLKVREEELGNRVTQMVAHEKELEKKIESVNQQLSHYRVQDLLKQIEEVHGIQILSAKIDNTDMKGLLLLLDQLKSKLKQAVILLAVVLEDQTIKLLAGVTSDCVDRFSAGDLIKQVSAQLGGKGGGKADMAQGGGNKLELLDSVLKSVKPWVQGHFGKTKK